MMRPNLAAENRPDNDSDLAGRMHDELLRFADQGDRTNARFYVSRLAFHIQSILDTSGSDADKVLKLRELIANVATPSATDRAASGLLCDRVA